MIELNPQEWAELANAIVVWAGYEISPYPRRDDARVVARIGSEAADRILPLIHEIEDALYLSDARLSAVDMVEMGNLASSDIHNLFPKLPAHAVEVLAWCYTYDFK